MKIERRNFLKKLAGVCVVGIAGGKATASAAGLSVKTGAASSTIGALAVAAPAAGVYGAKVRAQVFEVIVRQAMHGAPWREICVGPMAINKICPREVEAEVHRRRSQMNSSDCDCLICDSSHRKSGFCICQDCERKRTEQTQKYCAELKLIPHSEVSPCACESCRGQIKLQLENVSKSIDIKV